MQASDAMTLYLPNTRADLPCRLPNQHPSVVAHPGPVLIHVCHSVTTDLSKTRTAPPSNMVTDDEQPWRGEFHEPPIPNPNPANQGVAELRPPIR